VADAEPAATVTEAGMFGIPATLVESATTVPPVGAIRFNLTLQTVLLPGVSVVALHDSADGAMVLAVSAKVAETVLPFSDAVTDPLWSDEIVAAVTVNVALDTPAATVTEGVTMSRLDGLAAIARAAPPAGAPLERVAVQLVEPAEDKEVAAQFKELSVAAGWMVIVTV
jgi:hypothetical protein